MRLNGMLCTPGTSSGVRPGRASPLGRRGRHRQLQMIAGRREARRDAAPERLLTPSRGGVYGSSSGRRRSWTGRTCWAARLRSRPKPSSGSFTAASTGPHSTNQRQRSAGPTAKGLSRSLRPRQRTGGRGVLTIGATVCNWGHGARGLRLGVIGGSGLYALGRAGRVCLHPTDGK